jgi:hypothetical protein
MGYEASTGRSSAQAVRDKHVAGNHNTCVMTFAGAMANELQNMLSGQNYSPEYDSAPRWIPLLDRAKRIDPAPR